MLIRAWTWVAGTSEFSLRFPSVLAGVLALGALVAVAREITHLRPHPNQLVIPVLAGLLFALSDLEVMVAQEARSYTLSGLLVTLSLLMYLRWLRTDKWQLGVAFIVSTLLVIFTFYIGVFSSFAIGVHALFFLRGRQRITAIGMLVVSALLFVPWLWFVIIQQQIGKFAGHVVPAYESNLETLWYFRLSWFTDQWALMLGLFLLGFVVVQRTATGYRLQQPRWHIIALLTLWIAIPLGLAFALNNVLPVLYDYRLTQITIPIIILTAYGLANLDALARYTLVAVIIVYGVFIVDVFRPKLPWESYAEQVTEYVREGQGVISEMGGGDYTFDYYLTPLLPDSITWASTWQWRLESPETYESDMLGYADAYDSVWLARWIDDSDAETKLRATNHIPTYSDSLIYQGSILEIIRFDRLPESNVVRFDNGMVLRHSVVHDDGLVDLWWTTEQTLATDYVVSVKILAPDGFVVAQEDIQPQVGNQPTSTWQANTTIYDPHALNTPVGDNNVMVQLYSWENGTLTLVTSELGDDFFILLD
ncbi:MAG: hypothetical protein AAFV98_12850 [Chloroflexota bacterium]